MNITNLEMTQATVELFGGLVCMMIAVVIFLNSNERKSWNTLKWMFLFAAGLFFSEACAYIFRGNVNRFSLVMTQASNFAVFLLNILLVCLATRYLYALLREKGVSPGRGYQTAVRCCMLLAFAILLVNCFTGWMYTFDAVNYYHRGAAWYLYTALHLVCILTMSAMCLRYRASVRRATLFSLLLYAFMPVIAIVLQTFVYGFSFTTLGLFAALLLMLVAYIKEWSAVEEYDERDRGSGYFVILFVLMLFCMSGSMVTCLISIEHISEQNTEKNSMILAHMVHDGIENAFLKPIMVAETMSKDYSLKKNMVRSGQGYAEAVEEDVAAYLNSIREGFGYPMVFAVCDVSRAYYTADGISNYLDIENKPHDVWYKNFLAEGKHYDLDVDTDTANQWELSVFVNTEIRDEEGTFLGVCGVGVKMDDLQKVLREMEKQYDLKINLVDETGLIQVDTDTARIETESLDVSYFDKVGGEGFYYEADTGTCRMTKYMEDLGWYLVVEDLSPDRINVVSLTGSSIMIFAIGIVMMGIVFIVISVRERKAVRELRERRRLSVTDDLTGLYNRRAYDSDCARIEQSGRVPDLTLVMMDVNELKAANDTYGHGAGDELVLAAANCIETALGEYGRIYRTGGDEFVAVLECTEDVLKDQLTTFHHLTRQWKGRHQKGFTVSTGAVICAQYPELTFDQMKELADQRMYQNKEEYYARAGKTRRTR